MQKLRKKKRFFYFPLKFPALLLEISSDLFLFLGDRRNDSSLVFTMSDDHKALLRSPASSGSEFDLEAQPSPPVLSPSGRRSGISELLKNLDRKLSGRRLSQRQSPLPAFDQAHDELGDGAPPEWALLLIGCLLGLATGLCVAAFNRAVRERLVCSFNCALIGKVCSLSNWI